LEWLSGGHKPEAPGDIRGSDPAECVLSGGLILTNLLGGSAHEKADSVDVKALECTPGLKAIIQRSIGERRKRYKDAAAMLVAIEGTNEQETNPVRLPKSLADMCVVFTGVLNKASRSCVTRKRGGARVQPKITLKLTSWCWAPARSCERRA
jgi:hypothetical protein